MCNIKSGFIKVNGKVKRVKGCYNSYGGCNSFITEHGVFHRTVNKKEFAIDPKKVKQLR